MFSITRLHQSSSLRRKTRQAMLDVLSQRFVYHRGLPPVGPTSEQSFRSLLLQLLVGYWNFDLEEPTTLKEEHLCSLFKFFNGDLRSEELTHYCSGPECCSSKQHAVNKAGTDPDPGSLAHVSRAQRSTWLFSLAVSSLQSNRSQTSPQDGVHPSCGQQNAGRIPAWLILFLVQSNHSTIGTLPLQAAALLENVFYLAGNQLYQPSRWQMVMPSLLQWGAFLALHNIGAQSFFGANVLQLEDYRVGFVTSH